MKYLSLFSGIGGFDIAFERAGMVCDSVVEIDKNCQTILHKHFPNAKLYDDVRTVGKDTHERGTIDLVCGGFPCQDVSLAGKRAGLAGERSGLWFEFARIIDELEPRWIVAENVPGLLSSNKGADFEVIVRWLAERGYGVSWRILDAQYFGVAQRRRRVFIVGSLGNGRSAEILFEREGVSRDTPKGRKAGTTITHALNACPSISGRYDPNGETFVINPIVATSWTLRGGKEGGGKGYLGSEELGMTLGGQPQYIGVRRLTPTECERLQGFPDGWTDGQADSVRYRQLGNAVAVPVVEWIGKRIMNGD